MPLPAKTDHPYSVQTVVATQLGRMKNESLNWLFVAAVTHHRAVACFTSIVGHPLAKLLLLWNPACLVCFLYMGLWQTKLHWFYWNNLSCTSSWDQNSALWVLSHLDYLSPCFFTEHQPFSRIANLYDTFVKGPKIVIGNSSTVHHWKIAGGGIRGRNPSLPHLRDREFMYISN